MLNSNCYQIFHAICFLATLTLIGNCVYQYFLDKDMSQVEYQKYHEGQDSIYPSISICFNRDSLFLEEKIKDNVGVNVTSFDYLWFLSGYDTESSSSPFWNLEYDGVTVNLTDHLMEMEMKYGNKRTTWHVLGGELTWKQTLTYNHGRYMELNATDDNIEMIPSPKMYISHRSPFKKCYAIDIPFVQDKPMLRFNIKINGSIFKDGIMPTKKQFSTHFHLPNQQLKSLSTQSSWNSKYNASSNYVLKIRFGYVEILRRRNKQNFPCHMENDDKQRIERAIESIGCKPIYVKSQINRPVCRKEEQINDYFMEMERENTIPPCKSIQSLFDWYEENDVSDSIWNLDLEQESSLLELKLYALQDYYKEIIYQRSYGIEALIGNTGGYIGRF